MRKIKGLSNYPWASVVFETLEMSTTRIKEEIDSLTKIEKRLKEVNTSRIGRLNNLENLYILKVILQYKEEEAKRDKI